MGDLNAKVGGDPTGFEDIMGSHGTEQKNDNGLRLLSFCDFNNLVVTGTIFPHRAIHKATWVSPDGQTKNQIDHVMISRQDRTSLLDTSTTGCRRSQRSLPCESQDKTETQKLQSNKKL